MDKEEIIKWLLVIKVSLNNFPEISNSKKIKALGEAIRLLKNEQPELPTGSTAKNDLGVDCISREDALMCLTGMFENREYEPSELIKIFARRIKTLPSVTPQEPIWIPVSERLPEDRQQVFVTRRSGTVGDIMWNTWWHEQTDYSADKVIAWMPLPKPYEPQESEDT